MRSFRKKNAKHPPFLGILGQKGRFWTIFGQKGAIFELFFNTKNQKILMRGFSGKWARTYVRMDVRTYGGESKGPSTPSRDQKSENSDEPISKKLGKPHFYAFLRGLRGIRGD